MVPDVMAWAKRILAGLAVGAGLVSLALGLVVKFQAKLLYVPRLPGLHKIEHMTPDTVGLDFEDIQLKAADGTELHAWFMYPRGWTKSDRKKHPVIIFLQENAGSMALRLPFLHMAVKYLRCSILAPSYRGYGRSKGTPSETGIKQDTQAALEYLLQRSDVDKRQISVMGKSLGGATAIHLAAANPGKLCTVIIENTFTSIEDVAPKVLPPLKYIIGRNKALNFLVKDKWRNNEEIARIKDTPILLLSALQDEMLPPEQMRELYEIAKSSGAKNLTWVEFPEAHHMDAYEVATHHYWPAIIRFFQLHHLSNDGFDSEDSTGDFEDVGAEPGMQAMLRAEKTLGDVVGTANGVRVHHPT